MEKKLFVSGSRAMHLSDKHKELLDKYMAEGVEILVGDCPSGIDREVQEYLRSKLYLNVTVYYSVTPAEAEFIREHPVTHINAAKPRYIDPAAFSAHTWGVDPIVAFDKKGTRAFYTRKDEHMTEDCTISMVIWDGVSAGSKANINRAVGLNKNVILFIGDECKIRRAK